jgi:rhodanese-related sulfurtransferase
MQNLLSAPSLRTVLIDVREPHEYAAGFIPTALNIPITSQPDALFLSNEDFEDRFGFAKPLLDQEVVFYCRSGVRSAAAAQLAVQNGYTDVAEYQGSWLDWEKRGGVKSTEGPKGGG